MLQSAFVSTITGVYADFGAIGMAALEMVAARRGISLGDDDRQAVREGMRAAAPPDVREALMRLRDSGTAPGDPDQLDR